MKKINKAFSLVELMVVIAILAILAGIAIPSYKTYVLKSKIAAAYPIMDSVRSQLIDSYEGTGKWPTEISFGNLQIAANVATAISGDNVKVIIYEYDKNNNPNFARISVGLANLDGISENYVAPSTNTDSGGSTTESFGTDSVVSEVVFPLNGTYRTVCGVNAGLSYGTSVPVSYLPGTCKCPSLATVYAGTITGCDDY